MSVDGFRFERRARRPVVWAALGASLGFLGVAALQEDLMLAWGAVILAVPFTLWAALTSPTAGVAIASGQLSWWDGNTRNDLPLSQIARVVPSVRSDGAEDIVLHLTDGRKMPLPGSVLPPDATFSRALAEAGVELKPA